MVSIAATMAWLCGDAPNVQVQSTVGQSFAKKEASLQQVHTTH